MSREHLTLVVNNTSLEKKGYTNLGKLNGPLYRLGELVVVRPGAKYYFGEDEEDELVGAFLNPNLTKLIVLRKKGNIIYPRHFRCDNTEIDIHATFSSKTNPQIRVSRAIQVSTRLQSPTPFLNPIA